MFLENLLNIGQTEFEKKECESIRETHKMFKEFYPIYRGGFSILLKVVGLLTKEFEENKDCPFNKAALILLSRLIQHGESIRLLNDNGLYGNAFGIIRNIMGDLNMIQYLHFHPEFIELFLKEDSEDYQINKNFKKAFNEATIERDLSERGRNLHLDSFQALSKVIHPSSWGAQLYGTRGSKKDQYYLKYGPGFEIEKALAILSILVVIHYDFIDLILWHRYNNKLNINSTAWKKIKENVRKLESKVTEFSTIATQTLLDYKSVREKIGIK